MKKKFSKPTGGRNGNQLIIYGRHAVMAALQNPYRQIEKLLCTAENAAEITRKFPDIYPIVTDKRDIDRLLSPEAVHQGFALYCKPLEGMSIEELCAKSERMDNAHVLILDQVTDPQNIGAIIRSAAAFGALAVIVQDKNSPEESGAMAKAAAGTLELIPMVRVTNLSRAIDTLKKAGFWAVGMDGYAKTTIDEMDKNGKLAVIMGSEGAGMRRLVEESCDLTVRLPIAENVESLNVSTAAAVVLYELSLAGKCRG